MTARAKERGRRSGRVRMRMLEKDCLFIPLDSAVVTTPETMAAAVRALHTSGFIPFVKHSNSLTLDMLVEAIRATGESGKSDVRSLIATEVSPSFDLTTVLSLGYEIVFFPWENPDDLAEFVKRCEKIGAYGIASFGEPGSLEVLFGIEDPRIIAAHLPDVTFDDLPTYAAAYRETGVDSDSRIVWVNSTIGAGSSWQRQIRHKAGRTPRGGFGLLPGLILTDVFSPDCRDNVKEIEFAVVSARQRFVPYIGDYEPVG